MTDLQYIVAHLCWLRRYERAEITTAQTSKNDNDSTQTKSGKSKYCGKPLSLLLEKVTALPWTVLRSWILRRLGTRSTAACELFQFRYTHLGRYFWTTDMGERYYYGDKTCSICSANSRVPGEGCAGPGGVWFGYGHYYTSPWQRLDAVELQLRFADESSDTDEGRISPELAEPSNSTGARWVHQPFCWWKRAISKTEWDKIPDYRSHPAEHVDNDDVGFPDETVDPTKNTAVQELPLCAHCGTRQCRPQLPGLSPLNDSTRYTLCGGRCQECCDFHDSGSSLIFHSSLGRPGGIPAVIPTLCGPCARFQNFRQGRTPKLNSIPLGGWTGPCGGVSNYREISFLCWDCCLSKDVSCMILGADTVYLYYSKK